MEPDYIFCSEAHLHMSIKSPSIVCKVMLENFPSPQIAIAQWQRQSVTALGAKMYTNPHEHSL